VTRSNRGSFSIEYPLPYPAINHDHRYRLDLTPSSPSSRVRAFRPTFHVIFLAKQREYQRNVWVSGRLSDIPRSRSLKDILHI
jgi:hypothetical protein